MKTVLDVTCGSRCGWFNKNDPRAIFLDKRKETYIVTDNSKKTGKREIVINPDIVGDFKNLPFPDMSFSLIYFDPPHMFSPTETSWIRKKYGILKSGWEDEIRKGFQECFRVLRNHGTLVFKWSEVEIPVSQIMKLAPVPPLFGARCGKQSKTHWMVFIKEIG